MQLAKHVKQGQLLYLDKTCPNQSTDAISISENEHYRWLAFADVIQSVMHKRRAWQLTLPHQTAMLLPLLFFKPVNIFELGLGGGNLARYLSHLHDDISFTSIECNQRVIDCFSQYFNPEQAAINIIHDRAELWLTKQNLSRPIDWLICDIYQQQLLDFKETLALLDVFMSALTPQTCLSINLPDSSDQEVNLCLTVLQQLSSNHRIFYFHVPNYLNIVILVLPLHWQIDKALKRNKHSYLPKRTFLRWRKFWQYAKEV